MNVCILDGQKMNTSTSYVKIFISTGLTAMLIIPVVDQNIFLFCVKQKYKGI
uniref:Uncharacterized protein n=1 Tax=Anguilla anguilla TaxID=7936 RepID=A0A0E9S3G5_ANGAN